MQIMDSGQWKGAIGSDPRGNPSPEVDLYTDYLERCAPHATGVRAKVRFAPHTTPSFPQR